MIGIRVNYFVYAICVEVDGLHDVLLACTPDTLHRGPWKL